MSAGQLTISLNSAENGGNPDLFSFFFSLCVQKKEKKNSKGKKEGKKERREREGTDKESHITFRSIFGMVDSSLSHTIQERKRGGNIPVQPSSLIVTQG